MRLISGGTNRDSEAMNSRLCASVVLKGKLRLSFGQDLHGQENSIPNQNASNVISMSYEKNFRLNPVVGSSSRTHDLR